MLRISAIVAACLAVSPIVAFAQDTIGFQDKLTGALYGGVIGDGMGAPVEGRPSEEVRSKFGSWDFRRFIPPQKEGAPKGDGRITDT